MSPGRARPLRDRPTRRGTAAATIGCCRRRQRLLGVTQSAAPHPVLSCCAHILFTAVCYGGRVGVPLAWLWAWRTCRKHWQHGPSSTCLRNARRALSVSCFKRSLSPSTPVTGKINQVLVTYSRANRSIYEQRRELPPSAMMGSSTATAVRLSSCSSRSGLQSVGGRAASPAAPRRHRSAGSSRCWRAPRG